MTANQEQTYAISIETHIAGRDPNGGFSNDKLTVAERFSVSTNDFFELLGVLGELHGLADKLHAELGAPAKLMEERPRGTGYDLRLSVEIVRRSDADRCATNDRLDVTEHFAVLTKDFLEVLAVLGEVKKFGDKARSFFKDGKPSLSERTRAEINREHWAQVFTSTGQAYIDDVDDRTNFLLNTVEREFDRRSVERDLT